IRVVGKQRAQHAVVHTPGERGVLCMVYVVSASPHQGVSSSGHPIESVDVNAQEDVRTDVSANECPFVSTDVAVLITSHVDSQILVRPATQGIEGGSSPQSDVQSQFFFQNSARV